MILTKIKIDKNKKLKLKNKDILNAKNFSTEMLYLTEKEQCKKLCSLLNLNEKNIKKHSIIVNNVALKPIYTGYPVKNIDIIKTVSQLKNEKINKIIICAPSFDIETSTYYNNFNNIEISLVNETEFYYKVLKTISYESGLIFKPKLKGKQKINSLISTAFNKKRVKGYLLSGTILFFCSLVYRYNMYYIIFSSLMFIFAFISTINKSHNCSKICELDSINNKKTYQ